MRSTTFRAAAALALLGVTFFACATAQPGKSDKTGKTDESATLPSGAIVIVADTLERALKLGRSVYLSPAKYQAMLDELASLRRAGRAPKYASPSKCALKGKVEGTFLVLQAVFEFETVVPGTLVRLGCGQALATSVSLDGRTPALIAVKDGPDAGFALKAEEPGSHTLTLDLMVPLAARPGGLGFTLDLPRAAITTAEIELPPGSREPRLGGKAFDATMGFKDHRISGPLGPVEHLDLSWNAPGSSASTAVTVAEGTVSVRVEQRETFIEARLDLRVLGGQVSEWTLLVPRGAEVTVADNERVKEVKRSDRKQLSQMTIKLKKPSSDPLIATVKTSGRTPKPGEGKLFIGPFNVAGAVRQSGTLLVAGASADLHLELSPQGDLARRGLTEEEQRRDGSLVAAFRYGPTASTGPAWLALETEPVSGQIKARPTHELRLEDGDNGPTWRVKTTLLVTPRWADVDRLLVALPSGCEWDEEASQPLPPRVRSVSYDRTTRQVEFRLSRTGEGPAGAFTVRLAGRFTLPVDLSRSAQATLALPRPAGLLDGEGTLTVIVPPGIEVQPLDTFAGLELSHQTTHELSYRFVRRHPAQVGVSWRPYRPPVEANGSIQLTLGPGEGRVRHELEYRFPASEAPRRLRLRVPASVASSLMVRQGEARLEAGHLVLDPGGKAVRVLLEYTVPLPASGKASVPLVEPEGVSRVENKVLIWSESGRLPSLLGEGWAEAPLEAVPGHDRLPVLVARSSTIGRPLQLRLGAASTAPLLCNRALVRAIIDDNGVQAFRATYRVERLSGAPVDFELPGHAAAIGFAATLDGTALDYDLPDADPALKGRLVRLRLSAGLVAKPALLEISYRLAPANTSANPFQVRLLGPHLLGDPPGFPIRWMVSAPADWVILGPDPGPSMPRFWNWAGWLLAPRCAISEAGLERWLTSEEAEEGESLHPSLSLWSDGSSEVALTRVPRQGWLLGCSLMLAAIGLGLTRLATSGKPGRSAWAWAFTLFLLAGAVGVAATWPLLAAQLAYGCQPGLAVLLVLGLLMWLLSERRRRQVLYLPNFAKSRVGSSIERPRGEPPVQEQPSTVDAPHALGSAVERRGG